MSGDLIQFGIEGGIATLTLNRADKLNALDRATMAALSAALDKLDGAQDVRAVILTGTGKAFCAGGDIADWGSIAPGAFGFDWVRKGHALFDRFAQLRFPLIAAINGHALGGGLELAACADIRIADPRAKFGLPETSIGVVPGWSGTQRLVKRFGYPTVARMALGGDILTAAEAHGLGLVHAVAEEGKVMEAALRQAAKITARSPVANEIAKLMMLAADGEAAGAAIETLGSMLSAHSQDRAEGVDAFARKRTPNFKGHA